MTRPEALEAIHRALRSQGVEDRDVHEYLDWIEEDCARDWRAWWLRAVWAGLLGLLAGAAVCLLVR